MPKKPGRFFSAVTKMVFPKMNLAASSDPRQYIGKTVLAKKELDQPYEEIKIREVRGNLANEKCFEINGTHLVSMYSFFSQLIDGKLPTLEDEKEFELATQITRIKKIDGKKEKD